LLLNTETIGFWRHVALVQHSGSLNTKYLDFVAPYRHIFGRPNTISWGWSKNKATTNKIVSYANDQCLFIKFDGKRSTWVLL